jgi:hypothetical protein
MSSRRPSRPAPAPLPARRPSSPQAHDPRPATAFRARVTRGAVRRDEFSAPERWHEARDDGRLKFVVEPAGEGYLHVVTPEDVRQRLSLLPAQFANKVEVVQFSTMTRKRACFPCYGMQWGRTVYLYPIEKTLMEEYTRAPTPIQQQEARMYGGAWSYEGGLWKLSWTPATIRDFYLNNVLIHEVGHVNDERNTSSRDRERYANWFAIEYGYRASRGLALPGGPSHRPAKPR